LYSAVLAKPLMAISAARSDLRRHPALPWLLWLQEAWPLEAWPEQVQALSSQSRNYQDVFCQSYAGVSRVAFRGCLLSLEESSWKCSALPGVSSPAAVASAALVEAR
jgi:hypothetical protein